MTAVKELVLRVSAVIALFASVAFLAFVLAEWGWRAFGPDPVHVPVSAPADPAATILASGLFAAPAAAPPTTPPVTDEGTLAAGDTRLLGVFAERDGRGYALFRLPSGPKLVATGAEIAPGAHLVAVRPDGITVRDSGGERRVALRADGKAASAKPVVMASAAKGASRSAACVPPAGFLGPVLRLNAELFQGFIAKPESWTALVVPERGGLVVRDDSGFTSMLAMQKGDRLEQANGIALAAPDDVVGAVLKPLAANQAVRVTGARAGARREWLLLNAGNCPA